MMASTRVFGRPWLRWSLVGLVLLVGAEAWARTQPWSAPRFSSFLHYQQVFLPALRPGLDATGEAVLMTFDPRHPVQWVRAEKLPGSLRVFCLGGSATAGLGYSPNAAYARHLEALLRKAYPNRPIELINLGTVAISSKQILELVGDVLAHDDPDLMVVYSGNNEFLEPHALRYAAIHGGLTQRLRQTLRRSALVRALERLSAGPPTLQELPDRRGGEQPGLTQAQIIEDVRLSPQAILAQNDRYAANLREVADRCASHKVPVLVCTVAANWLWSGKEARSFEWFAAKDSAQMTAREVDLQTALAAPITDVKTRWLQWVELGDLRAALADEAGAAQAYREALELDPHQRRATLAQAEALTAALRGGPSPAFDTTGFFLARSKSPWIGFDVFYDYVHFTPYGAALMAEALYGELCQRGLLDGADPRVADGYARGFQAQVLVQSQLPQTPDFLEPGAFLGYGLNPARIEATDLWKYEQMTQELDESIAKHPQDPVAYVYRGNRRWFQQGKGPEALADWSKALQLGGPEAILRPAIEALEARPRLLDTKKFATEPE